jgi:capsular polysaccharide biosynthesis protein
MREAGRFLQADEMTPLFVEREAQKLADAGEWDALALFVSPHLTRTARARTLFLATMAATETQSSKLLDAVIGLAVAADLPAHIALGIARRMAMAGEVSAAWGVLLTATSLTGDKQHGPAIAGILAIIVQFSKDRALRLAATAYQQRLAGMAAPVRSDRIITWGTEQPPSALARPANPVRLFNEDMAPPAVLAELEQVRATFEGALTRDVRPTVHVYDNVLVNRSGQVWRDGGEVIVSTNRPVPAASMAAAADARVIGNGILAMEDAGLYHWLCEWLPSLFWAAYQGAASPAILLSDRAAGYQIPSLDMLTTEAARVLVGDAIRVERLHVGDRRLLNYRYWGAYQEGFRRINAAARTQATSAAGTDIYISRRDASRRPIVNEPEVGEALARVGFTCVELSGMSLAEQVVLFGKARRIVAPHGAGLSHLLAMEGTAKVLELFPMSAGSMSLRYNFARLSRLRGHTHALHLERINPLTNAWRIDVSRLLRTVDDVLYR